MKVLAVFLFSWGALTSHAQDIKSFRTSNPKKDSSWVKSLIDFGMGYEKNDPDSAILIYAQVIQVSKAIKYIPGIAKGYHYSGIVYSDKGNYSQAVLHYHRAVELYKSINDTKGESGCYLNLGNVYYFEGIFKESLDYYLRSLALVEANYDSAKMPTLYSNLGSLYSSTREYGRSIDFLTKSLRIAEIKKDSTGMMHGCINLGVTLLNNEKLDSAEICFFKALKLAGYLHDADQQYVSLNNLAEIQKSKGNYEKALQCSVQSLEKAKETGMPYSISSATLVVGHHYVNMKNYPVGIRYLKEGLRISIEHKVLQNMALGHDWLSKAEEKVGQFKEALSDYRLATLYYDSISSESTFKEMGSLEGKYELEKELREKKIADERMATQQQIQRDRRDHIQYFIIVLVLAILFVVIKLVGNLNMPEKASHMITLIAVILFFEFLLVIIDPYVESLSSNVPVYKLIINLLLALLIFPIHEWLLKILSIKRSVA